MAVPRKDFVVALHVSWGLNVVVMAATGMRALLLIVRCEDPDLGCVQDEGCLHVVVTLGSFFSIRGVSW